MIYEHLYIGNNHVKALEKCRKANPEFEDCILIAQTFDPEEEKNKEYFKALLRCDCVG